MQFCAILKLTHKG